MKADAISSMDNQLTSVTSRSARRSSAILCLKEELKVEFDKSAEHLAEIKRLELSATASDATIKSMRKELQHIQDTASLEIARMKKELAAVSSISAKQQEAISAFVLELQSEKEVSAGLVASFNDLKVELDFKVDACSDLTTTLGKAEESLTAANVSVAAFQEECEILSATNNTLSDKLSSMSLLIKGNDDQKTDFSKRLGVMSIELQTATREIGVLKSKLTAAIEQVSIRESAITALTSKNEVQESLLKNLNQERGNNFASICLKNDEITSLNVELKLKDDLLQGTFLL